jgi:hypothetical protein
VGKVYSGEYNTANVVFYVRGLGILPQLSRTIEGGNIRAESVGNYALFAGGQDHNNGVGLVEIWNNLLVEQNCLYLSSITLYHCSTVLKNYALFGLYSNNYGNNVYNYIDCFNNQLVRTTLTSFQTAGYGSAGSVGDYALFMGGKDNSFDFDTVTCINSNLIKSMTNLSMPYHFNAGGENSVYCFMCGGTHGYKYNSIEAFNSQLTRYICLDMTNGIDYINSGGAGSKNYFFIFNGGLDFLNTPVDFYDTSLTKNILLLPHKIVTGTAFSDRDKYTISYSWHYLSIIKDSILIQTYNNIPFNARSGSDGTFLGKYMLVCDIHEVFVAELRD